MKTYLSCTTLGLLFIFSVLRKKKKDKRQRRVNQNDLTIEELLDSPQFRKFSNAVEYVFDSAEDINFGSLDPSKSCLILKSFLILNNFLSCIKTTSSTSTQLLSGAV